MRIAIGCDHIVTNEKWLFLIFEIKGDTKCSTLGLMTIHGPLIQSLVRKPREAVVRPLRSWCLYLWYWCWDFINAVNKVPGNPFRLVRDMTNRSLCKEELNANVIGFGGKITGELLMCDTELSSS